jgi:hypothetical protein
MNTEAIIKAERRFAKAQDAFDRVRRSTCWDEFEPAWSDLLLAGNSIYSVLEQGAKTDPQSRQWFGGKKKQRRADTLLQYMHQARNADEHGILAVAEHVEGRQSIPSYGRPVVIRNLLVTPQGIQNLDGEFLDDGSPLHVVTELPHARLVTVTDERFGLRFDPPEEHLGARIATPSPKSVGELWLAYLGRLIEEAKCI